MISFHLVMYTERDYLTGTVKTLLVLISHRIQKQQNILPSSCRILNNELLVDNVRYIQ